MPRRTHREQVLGTLRLSRVPLDDDELSAKAAIRPRQTVNQVCRALERDGLVRRRTGPDGKITNELVDTDSAGVGTADTASIDRSQPAAPADNELPAGNSHEQRAAERLMLDALSARFGVPLEPTRITVSGPRVEVDGADPALSVLVECWAHQGSPKSAQRHKVLADAFKLTWVAHTRYPKPRLVLCLSDAEAAAPFLPKSRSWAARALQDMSIEVHVVELPGHIRQELRAAQIRQYR